MDGIFPNIKKYQWSIPTDNYLFIGKEKFKQLQWVKFQENTLVIKLQLSRKGGHERVTGVRDWKGFSSVAQQHREVLGPGTVKPPTVSLQQQQWKKLLWVWRAYLNYQTQESTEWCSVWIFFFSKFKCECSL